MTTTKMVVDENYKGWKIERLVTEYMTSQSTQSQQDVSFEAEFRNSNTIQPMRDFKIEGLLKQIAVWYEALPR